ncbi:hypothetical protein LN042_13640 [Kitasatospora sp. RB6PN24]|uniref:hypothetical protein n=1 Tax=Kitasatospora humi TaxID=2893891 RepID=UPI001E5B6630|nr:hypothetical protein [Kitasatospora humi]MCC9308116.1 hypothetical protein [Kitasatospora humi]
MPYQKATVGRAGAHEVAQLAGRLGFGPARGSRALGGDGLGCLALGVAIVLLAPGVGLTAGPYGPAVTALGAIFLAAAVSLVPLALALRRRRADRTPRLHLFEGGMILTRSGEVTAHRWSDVRLVEYTYTSVAGGQGSTRRATGTRLEHVDGRTLCSLGSGRLSDEVTRIAVEGGARTP